LLLRIYCVLSWSLYAFVVPTFYQAVPSLRQTKLPHLPEQIAHGLRSRPITIQNVYVSTFTDECRHWRDQASRATFWGSPSEGFLAKITKGYTDLLKPNVLPGDTVSVLVGYLSPTILRTRSHGKHLFVGCSYVHGIADGDALLIYFRGLRIEIKKDDRGL
jgi:hypothetical protein